MPTFEETNGRIDEASKCALGTRSLGAAAHECSNEETHEELHPSCLHMPSGGGSGKELGREEEAWREWEEEAMRIWEEEMHLSVYMPADEALWTGGGIHMQTHGHAVYESWKEDDNTSCDVPMCFRVLFFLIECACLSACVRACVCRVRASRGR